MAEEKTKQKKIWDNYREVAHVRKNDRLKFVIVAGCREGYRCISIREFYWRKKDNSWQPGRDGIVIPLVSPLGKTNRPDCTAVPTMIRPMDGMLEDIKKAIEVVSEMDLADPAHELWATFTVKEKN